ncbi:MAG: PorT family protein [Tannerellaceae bacterium]|jgi:hypothetical protein|nr:PorT family protein [Tannerellaceae bacterium]
MLKKSLFFCLMVIAAISANAQAQALPLEGVVGLNSSNMGDIGSKIGFHLGVKTDIALPSVSNGVYANAGALLSSKGASVKIYDITYKVDAYYLEIPVHIGYKTALNDDFFLYGEAGPYLAFGLFGKAGVDKEKYNTFGSAEEGGLKRFDLGLGIKVGLEIKKKYTLSIGYDWGFIDASRNSGEDGGYDEELEMDMNPTMKNTNFSISFGYKFKTL